MAIVFLQMNLDSYCQIFLLEFSMENLNFAD